MMSRRQLFDRSFVSPASNLWGAVSDTLEGVQAGPGTAAGQTQDEQDQPPMTTGNRDGRATSPEW